MESEAFLATRRSLITRLKDWEDQESWQEFFQLYWKLIYSVAIKAGLTDSEAEDVVQETVVSVARTLREHRYDPERCRFKTWLMGITRRRVVDQFRKRKPQFASQPPRPDPSTRTSTEERIPDPAPSFEDMLWEEEWRKNLVGAAMDRVKKRVKPEHYQIFYLAVVKELRAAEVARTLGVSAAQVYLVKHRIAARVKREIHCLEKKMSAG
jgi:RNA polymerase sigma-70 factor (ECF subfamily)